MIDIDFTLDLARIGEWIGQWGFVGVMCGVVRYLLDRWTGRTNTE